MRASVHVARHCQSFPLLEPYLLLVSPGGGHTGLSVPNLLQDASAVLQVLGIQIFLFGNLGQQDTKLVADVAHGLVFSALAPLAQLGCDALRLLSGLLKGADGVVLRLDQQTKLLGELGSPACHITQGRHGETVLDARARVIALVAERAFATNVPVWCARCSVMQCSAVQCSFIREGHPRTCWQ